jgi:hypothetical protein
MSALPPKADINRVWRDVRFVPKADTCSAAKERRRRARECGRQGDLVGPCGSQIDDDLECRGSFKFRLGGRHL